MYNPFDFDPDEIFEENAEENLEEVLEEDIDSFEEEDPSDDKDKDDEGISLQDAILAGTIFAVAEENVREDVLKEKDTQQKMKRKNERSSGAVSLKKRKGVKGRKRSPFEQWVWDVIRGRKTLDDDL